MKTMSCSQLGGGCEEVFQAETFDEMADLIKRHQRKMYLRRDVAHLDAMAAMLEISTDPQKLAQWFDDKRKEFEAYPESA